MTDASKSEPVFERCQHIFAPHGCGADNQCAREAGHAGSHWCPYSKEGLENLQQCALRNLSSPSIDELDQDESLGSLKRQTLIRQRAIELEASIEALTRQLAEEKERADHLQVCLTQDNDKLDALTRQRDGLRKLLEESMNVFLHDADCFKSSAAEHMAKKLKAAIAAAKEKP